MTDLFRGRSGFHDITVEVCDGRLEMRFSGRSQSATDEATRSHLGAPVLGYLHIPVALAGPSGRALVVGLGGGVLPRAFLRDYPRMAVDVCEIDPEVVRLCEEFFGLPADERLRIIVEGGRQYLERTDERYDVVVIDAFFVHPTAGYATPFELVTHEFFELVRERMTPGGALAFNIVGALSGRGSGPLHRLVRGLADTFPSVHLVRVRGAKSRAAGRANYVAIATVKPLSAGEVRERIRAAAGGLVSVDAFASFADDLLDAPFGFRGVRAHRDADMPATRLMQG